MTMKRVTSLFINKYRRKYNDVIRRKLRNAGIAYKEEDTRRGNGINVMVPLDQFDAALAIVLSVSHTNPQY